MTKITLEAENREIVGKGASRRLRRLDNKVPGIIYGGDKDSVAIQLLHNKVIKALENEAIYSSIIDVKVGGKVEHVLLKDLHRHPYKPVIMHMDLQRVNPTEVIHKMVPLHFINEEASKGVKAGGKVSHTLNQIEVVCQAKHLPEFIEIDLTDLDIDEVLHLSQIKLAKNVKLAIDTADGIHDLPVVSIHMPKISSQDLEAEEAEQAAAAAESAESQEETAPKAEDASEQAAE